MSTADPFRIAATAYLVYGIVYWVGGLYLALHGVGVRGSAVSAGFSWIVVGALLVFLIPYLLARPRPWFERWILTRRDFARILVVLMVFRAMKVGQVAVRPDTATVAAPWDGVITFRLGAILFFIVTVTTLALIARAAWTEPRPSIPAHPRSNPSTPSPVS